MNKITLFLTICLACAPIMKVFAEDTNPPNIETSIAQPNVDSATNEINMDEERKKQEEAAKKQAEEEKKQQEEAAKKQVEAEKQQREEAARNQAENEKKQQEDVAKNQDKEPTRAEINSSVINMSPNIKILGAPSSQQQLTDNDKSTVNITNNQNRIDVPSAKSGKVLLIKKESRAHQVMRRFHVVEIARKENQHPVVTTAPSVQQHYIRSNSQPSESKVLVISNNSEVARRAPAAKPQQHIIVVTSSPQPLVKSPTVITPLQVTSYDLSSENGYRQRELHERSLRIRENKMRNRENQLRERELNYSERARALRDREWYSQKLRITQWENARERDQELKYLLWLENQINHIFWRENRQICHYVTTYRKGIRLDKRVTICERRNGRKYCHHPLRYVIFPVTKLVCYRPQDRRLVGCIIRPSKIKYTEW